MKILVVEDQGMIRSMVTRFCCERLDCGKVTTAMNLAEADLACAKEKPDVILLDIGLPDGDGLDHVPELRKAAPRAKIIILSSHTNAYSLTRIHNAPVDGFVDKNEPSPDVLVDAIKAVVSGGTWFSVVVERTHAALRADPNAFTKILSEQEQRLLSLYGQGLTNEQIAPLVGLSANTVRNHRRNIMGKLGLHSSADLVTYAREKGFTRTGA